MDIKALDDAAENVAAAIMFMAFVGAVLYVAFIMNVVAFSIALSVFRVDYDMATANQLMAIATSILEMIGVGLLVVFSAAFLVRCAFTLVATSGHLAGKRDQ